MRRDRPRGRRRRPGHKCHSCLLRRERFFFVCDVLSKKGEARGKKLRLRRRLIDVVFSDKLVRSICYGTERSGAEQNRRPCRCAAKPKPKIALVAAVLKDERASKVCGIHYNVVSKTAGMQGLLAKSRL